MGEITVESMSQNYLDVLKELGNIGAGNATTALATMLQTKVDMSVPQVRLLKFPEVGAILGGEEQIVAGVYLAISGDITGSIMFLVKEEVAVHLINKLMGSETARDLQGELERSALK